MTPPTLSQYCLDIATGILQLRDILHQVIENRFHQMLRPRYTIYKILYIYVYKKIDSRHTHTS